MDSILTGSFSDGLIETSTHRLDLRFRDIEPGSANSFYVIPDGLPAVLIPVFDGNDTLNPFDEAAFSIEDPDQVYTLRGAAAILGYDHIDHAVSTGEPLRLRRNPQKWLAANCDGIAIVDWFLAPALLRRLTAVICDDEIIAERLFEKWRQCQSHPEILVIRESE